MGIIHRADEDFEVANSFLQEAVDVYRRLPADLRFRGETPVIHLALLRRRTGDHAEAVRLLEAELARVRQLEASPGLARAELLRVLGETYFLIKDFEAAEPLIEQSYEVRRQLLGEDHPSTHLSLVTLGSFLRSKGDLERAEVLLRRALPGARNQKDERLRALSVTQFELAQVLYESERASEALPFFRSSLELTRKGLGPLHAQVATHLHGLALALQALGDYDGAERELREALAIELEIHDPSHPNLGYDYMALAGLLTAAGRPHEAIPLSEQAIDIFRQAFPTNNTLETLAKSVLAGALIGQQRYEEAEGLLLECLEILDAKGVKVHELRPTLNRLLLLYESSQQPDLAEPIARRLEALLEPVSPPQ